MSSDRVGYDAWTWDSGDRNAGAPSAETASGGLRARLADEVTDNRLAVAGVALLLLAALTPLYTVVDIVGGVGAFLLVAAVTVAGATVLARVLRERTALAVSGVVLAVGGVAYFYSIPESQRALFTVGRILADTGALLTGLSVLRLFQADVWVMTITPAPLFLSWYLVLRGRYVTATLVGGGLLSFLVLTGDASLATTLAGVLGAAAAVGFGTLEDLGGLDAQWDTVTFVLAVMVLASASLSVVPGGSASPLFVDRGSPTLESNLVSNTDRVGIVGSIRLSPKVRFTVEADAERGRYWKTGAYDRYTGGGWVRTGESTPYDGRLSGPPGASERLVQQVTARTEMNALPAAWKPVVIRGAIERATQVTEHGGLRAAAALQANESYTVVSRTPQYTTAQLRTAGTDYPEAVRERYLQLPESTPDRVARKTAEIIREANASNPYDAAVAIERYLEANKEYSLQVERPEGNIADSFLFEMDAGYCSYYATTMVVMLRSQGIPARFVSGYTPGERVAADKWVVRGLDAHSWVEVYFPGVGWVTFDPTPGGPRESAESTRLAEARENDVAGVDTAETGPGREWTPTPEPGETETATAGNQTPIAGEQINPGNLQAGQITPAGGANGTVQTAGTGTAAAGGGGGGEGGVDLPSRETVGYAAAALVGVVAGARRLGLLAALYGFVWLRYQRPTDDPDADAVRAYRRLERLLAMTHRPRRNGETVRDYLAAMPTLDDRVHEVAAAHERARYGGGVDREEADAAIDAVDDLVRDAGPLRSRLRRGRPDRRAVAGS